MEWMVYWLARGLVWFLQSLPLTAVARLGRACGGLAYFLDHRHRKVALDNLHMCLGQERSTEEIRGLARENFRRLGENYACAVKTAAMTPQQLWSHCTFVGAEKILDGKSEAERQSLVVAIGHFGNFELYARFGQFLPRFQCATTYRGLPQASLNRLMQSLRERSGCLFFERRTDGNALKAAMNREELLLGLLADQHAGNNGLWIPFFGKECSTSAAPAVFALRYHCALHTGICYRVGLAHWQIEAGDAIPIHENGRPRSTEAITLDINRAFEAAIRRDPANWFWVHKRWKPKKTNARRRSTSP